jgi:hypothetical protein
MKQVVKLNWKITDLIREEQSFANWHWNVFKLAPSPKDLKYIKKRVTTFEHSIARANLP